jgi:sulfite reductase alpha subunit-like flavoprotein
MSAPITILVATMSGTAEMVADELASRIEDTGGSARIMRMERANAATLADANGPVLICTSTYGAGDVPDNGMTLYAALEAERPDLSALRYGIVALGDSVYPQTYCFGGKKFDTLLASLAAKRVGERLEHDARSKVYPEDAAGEWIEQWLDALDS